MLIIMTNDLLEYKQQLQKVQLSFVMKLNELFIDDMRVMMLAMRSKF